MFYDRTLSHRINRIHKRALRFAYKDYQTHFESLLEQRNLLSIHVKNLQLLMIEIYKTKSGLSPPFMKDIFAERNTGYNLRYGNDSQLPKVHTTTWNCDYILPRKQALVSFTKYIQTSKHTFYFLKPY